MKTLLVLFLFMSYCTIFAQSPQAQPFEIYFGSVISPITMTLTAQTTVWKSSSNHVFEKVNTSLHPDYYSSSVTPPDNNVIGSLGWDFTILDNYNIPDPHFGGGIYKVTNSLNDKYFYLNYLDDEAGFYNPLTIDKCTLAHQIDVWIKYDQSSFWYINNGDANPPLGSCQWNQIQNGQILNIWSMKYNTRTPTTTKFPDYWTNCVAATKNINSHPTIIWGPYSHQDYPFTPNGYRIYRKYDQYSPNFELLSQVNANTFSYIDNSISIASPGQSTGLPISYYVVAINTNNQESIHSNTVDVLIHGNFPEKLKPSKSLSQIDEFKLSQCYPNPFNPSTSITYQIPNPGNVTLKVYDILGKEVVALVNEYKNVGQYSVNFDASKLSSGIYIYQLKSNDFISSKKMMLLK